jgi:hypothetical protein
MNLEEVPMKRALLVLAAIAAVAAFAGAQQAQQALSPTGLQAELGAALQEMSVSQLGTLTVGDLIRLAARISVADQQERYVQNVRNMSLHFPGAGQFMTGDAQDGALFLAGGVTVIAGTLIGAYLLLPSSVQFSTLDYFHDSLSTIRSRWEGNSIVDYLPACGIMLGGMILKGILGHFSAEEAVKKARQNIADGTVTFTPNLEFLGGRPEAGMRMRY